jgi:ABC-type dipeptide/oligopeptide/nickel transport system permease component
VGWRSGSPQKKPPDLILWHHVLCHAALQIVTYVSVQSAYLTTMVQGTALVLGLTYVAVNLIVSLAPPGIDPSERSA